MVTCRCPEGMVWVTGREASDVPRREFTDAVQSPEDERDSGSDGEVKGIRTSGIGAAEVFRRGEPFAPSGLPAVRPGTSLRFTDTLEAGAFVDGRRGRSSCNFGTSGRGWWLIASSLKR